MMKFITILVLLMLGSFAFSQGGGDGNHYDLGCEELTMPVCSNLPFCEWNYDTFECVDGEFDWGGGGQGGWGSDSTWGDWNDWMNEGECELLDFETCDLVPMCEWQDDMNECTTFDGYHVAISIENINILDNTFDVYIDTDRPFFNFQLNFSGLEINNISGGIAEEYNFEIELGDSYVVGFLSDMNEIPEGSGLLFTLSFTPVADVICVYNGHCNGMWSNGNWDSETGVEASDCEILTESDGTNYYANVLSGYLPEYLEYVSESEEDSTGVIGYITIEASDDLDFGDDIGLLDYNGIIDYDECPADQGEVIAGAGSWQGTPITIPVYGSIDECDEGNVLLPGFVEDNPIYIHAWDESEGVERILQISDRNELVWQDNFIIIQNIHFIQDPNNDGIMDVLDIVFMVNIIIDMDYAQSADINNDGIVNVLDIVLVVNTILNNN